MDGKGDPGCHRMGLLGFSPGAEVNKAAYRTGCRVQVGEAENPSLELSVQEQEHMYLRGAE